MDPTASKTSASLSRTVARAAPTQTIFAALFLTALTLRPQLVGAGPLIPEIQQDLAVTHAAAGLLGTIPVLCMGVFAPVAPLIAARLGTVAAIALSLLLIGGFGLARAAAGDATAVIVLTLGLGIGMGTAGSLLPVYVKERLAARPIAGTIAYSSGVQLGAAASAAAAVPLALALGGWRMALAVFSGATLLLAVAWIVPALSRRRSGEASRLAFSSRDFSDHRGWHLALTFAAFSSVYYGLIAWLTKAYVEVGWTAVAAGGLIAILNVSSLAGALTVGLVAGRRISHTASLGLLGTLFAVAIAGFVVAPDAAVGWAVLAGYTNGALFPLLLALPLRLSTSAAGAAGMSSVTLGVGYTIAAASPVLLGAVRDLSGTFRWGFVALVILAAAFAAGTVIAARWPTPNEAREGGA